MKTSFKFLSLFSLFFIFALTSCKDECKDVDCLNGAACDEGDCICVAGFEGDRCQTETRAKFFGSYNVSENCNVSGNFTYQITIVTSAASVQSVIINNFYGVGASVTATTSGNAITIPNQTLNVQGSALTFSGSGQINGNILTLSYTIAGDGGSETCTATCTKQ